MTAQPALPGMVSAATFEADLRARDDDPTPRGVVRAVLGAVGHMWLRDPSKMFRTRQTARVIDVCAGFGCWASEFRRWWCVTRTATGCIEWPVHITGVELDARKHEHLAKWCDEVHTGDWRQALGRGRDVACVAEDYIPGDDLVIGNPAFSQLTHDDPHQSMPAVLLRHAPAVLLLHTQQAFLKSEAGRAAWRAYPPAASWLVPGGVKFRGSKKGTDMTCYQVTLWLRGHAGPCSTHLLDDLTPAQRSWSTLPGTEDAATAEALGLPMVGQP